MGICFIDEAGNSKSYKSMGIFLNSFNEIDYSLLVVGEKTGHDEIF